MWACPLRGGHQVTVTEPLPAIACTWVGAPGVALFACALVAAGHWPCSVSGPGWLCAGAGGAPASPAVAATVSAHMPVTTQPASDRLLVSPPEIDRLVDRRR